MRGWLVLKIRRMLFETVDLTNLEAKWTRIKS